MSESDRTRWARESRGRNFQPPAHDRDRLSSRPDREQPTPDARPDPRSQPWRESPRERRRAPRADGPRQRSFTGQTRQPRNWNDTSWLAEDGQDEHSSPQSRRQRDQRIDDVWAPPDRGSVAHGRANRAQGRGQSLAARGGAPWRDPSATNAPAGRRHSRLLVWLDKRLPTSPRARITAIVLLVVMLVCAVGTVPASIVVYASTMALAKDGAAQLKLAQTDFATLATNPTNSAVLDDAQSHLRRAHDDFAQIQFRVGALAPAQGLPKVGSRVGAAARLAPLAVAGTQAGILACDALKVLVAGLKNPLGTTGGLTLADTDKIRGDVDQIQALVGQIGGALGQVQPSDLTIDPRLGPLVATARQKLPQITKLVADLDAFTHALPQLLGVGKASTYLVFILDSSELRPTGGFIGNFGTISLTSGRMDPNFHISDITLIDSSVKFGNVPNQQVIPIPAQYSWFKSIFAAGSTDSWSVRDSNLDPDYPTVSRTALQLYAQLLPDAQKNIQASGSPLVLYNPQVSGQFAGVVTLSLGFFQQALGITGEIHVQDGPINETVNAQNFVQKIHYYALAAPGTGADNQVCGDTSCAKVFTSDVVKAFMAKVKSNLSHYLGGLARIFYDSLRTKDIEVYLTDPQAQQLLSGLHLAAEVQAPATGDSVLQVDANIGANKDNAFLQYAMGDQVAIDQSGVATHNLSWQYTWPNDPATFAESFAAGSRNYHSYSRVFVPPSATLVTQSNLQNFGQSDASSATFNRKVFSGAAYAFSNLGQTSNYGVSWKVPGAVMHDSAGFHYHLLFQREAGIIWPLTLAITLPTCATLSGAPQTSGFTTADKYTMKGRVFTMSGPLTQDIQVQLDYTC